MNAYRATFNIIDDNVGILSRDHKQKCEKLGLSRCRVIEFMPGGNDYGQLGSIRILLAQGTAADFLADISKSTKSGFRVHQENRRHSKSQEEYDLEKKLLYAQRETLSSVKKEGSDDFNESLQRKSAEIESSINRIERELSNLRKNKALDTIYITYEKRNHRYSRWSRDLDQAGGIFVISILVISGIALLTAIYFGIIFLVFLWLRRFSIKRGLLKG